MKSIIRVKSKIKPHQFTSDILKTIESDVKQKYEGSCTKKFGCLSNLRVIKINNEKISTVSANAIFDVTVEADAIKPKKGLTLDVSISEMSDMSINSQVSNHIFIMIPKNKTEMKYDKDTHVYFNNNKKLKIGDKVKVLIEVTEFNNESFQCIGSLIN